MDGLLIVDKPPGPTSHDVVHQLKRLLKTKTGHTGTLDPLAAGVLCVLIGRATRLAQFFQGEDKEYLAEVRLGIATDTYDLEGRVTDEKPVPELSRAQLEGVLAKFRGRISQRAPRYSAVKVQGRKLYELARQEIEITPPERTVEIHTLELLEHGPRSLRLRVTCSAGTYIRSLAHDIGQELGCGAHLASLVRTRAGAFDRSQAVPLERVAVHAGESLIPLEQLLLDMPRLDLDDLTATRVRHGNHFAPETPLCSVHYRLFHRDRLIAIGRSLGGLIHPQVVLDPA
ncbi:MAG TPA: tRNA pseudouridine(55) synthase TruB [Acidobacteriota bacterium]|mgnify:CR=1 FL=1|nr:tRNA pseudouridine(55) synthase TruB [Acidobacteriota bacterium]